jgi:carbamoylphosphate synthase small subunit
LLATYEPSDAFNIITMAYPLDASLGLSNAATLSESVFVDGLFIATYVTSENAGVLVSEMRLESSKKGAKMYFSQRIAPSLIKKITG